MLSRSTKLPPETPAEPVTPISFTLIFAAVALKLLKATVPPTMPPKVMAPNPAFSVKS